MSLEPPAVVWQAGAIAHTVSVLDLDGATAGPVGGSPEGVVIGVTRDPSAVSSHRLDAMTVTYTESSAGRAGIDRRVVAVDDLDAALATVTAAVQQAPAASAVLCQLLRLSERLDVADALRAESLAYSMLLAGPEFGRWLAARPPSPPREPTARVEVQREDDLLHITLADPARRNPFSAALRDQLYDALDIAIADQGTRVLLDGAGANFCSGGDLTEFGSAPDVVAAHVIRTGRAVGLRLAELGDRATVHVHGGCVGAGFELPGFAGTVVADPGATFRLPEVAMGLIPGAGGTVSIARRIGRWRLAHIALTGCVVTAEQALAWGAVDLLRSLDRRVE